MSMDTEVTCPDCGKVIAPAGAVDNALRCRCGEAPNGPKVTPDEVPLRPSISVQVPEVPVANTSDDSDTSGSSESLTATKKEKKCYVCGADLAGRTRLKDHLGRYWCKECAAADERAKKREEELRCPDCGRVFPAHKLVYFQVTKVCSSCFKEREKELEKKIKKAAAEKIHEKAEWQSIKWLAIVAGVLILLGLIGYLMH
jgi:uncharacterized C2H2 Zn-finger protein